MRNASIGFNYIPSLTGKFNQIIQGWRIHHPCSACGMCSHSMCCCRLFSRSPGLGISLGNNLSKEDVFSGTSVSAGDFCDRVFHVPAEALNTKANTLKETGQDSPLLEPNIDCKCGFFSFPVCGQF